MAKIKITRNRKAPFRRARYVTTKLMPEVIRRLDRYAADRLATRAEAVRDLVARGLDHAERAS